MFIRTFSGVLVSTLLALASLCTIYLYLYPLCHGCGFALTSASRTAGLPETRAQHWPFLGAFGQKRQKLRAPFRLLVLADPQLEGDSSLPDPDAGFLRRLAQHADRVSAPQPKSLRKQAIRKALKDLFVTDIPEVLQGLRKRLDLFGNDYYLAHIFRTLRWWTQPTHITVLGDLLGSQWMTDEEFEARAWRYWNRVFAGAHRVEDQVTAGPVEEPDVHNPLNRDMSGYGDWADRIINVAGNHDIGYAGDISEARIARFEKYFGRADWDTRFAAPITDPQKGSPLMPSLHLIVLNDLILDTPALDSDLQSAAYEHLNSIITQRSHPVDDKGSFTLLLTHVPLYKPDGVCVDAPYFSFYESDDGKRGYKSGGLKEQNHLSDHISRSGILEGIFGMTANQNAAGGGRGRKGLILTGHDHHGCDVWHHIPHPTGEAAAGGHDQESVKSDSWNSVPWRDANMNASHTGVREVTLRSMMGDFGGNAGLLSLWFDSDHGEWKYEIQMCQLGVQHIWWGIHALDLITICVAASWVLSSCFSSSPSPATLETNTGARSMKAKDSNATSMEE